MSAVLELPLDQPAPAAPARAVLDHATDMVQWLAERKEPPFRLKQIHRQIFAGRADSFAAMTDLPKKLRDDLQRDWSVFSTTIDKHLTASDGTQKLMLRLHDGRLIECVLLGEANRRTA